MNAGNASGRRNAVNERLKNEQYEEDYHPPAPRPGEGSITYREDKRLWIGEISLGYDGNSKRIRKTAYAATKGEVAEKLRSLQAEHDAGRLVVAEDLTTGEYLARWLKSIEASVGSTTWERYRHAVELHLVPVLGRVRLSKLRPLHVEQAYTSIRNSTTSATARVAGMVLSTALRHAVRLKLINSNPAADVKRPKSAAGEMLYMTAGQVKHFFETARRRDSYPIFALAIATGMRQGELLGLRWGDVDFDKGTIEVRRSLTVVKGEFVTKEPKTRTSRRTITVPPFALVALRDLRAEALKRGLIAAPVFCTRTGRYRDKRNVLRSFKRVVKAANRGAEPAQVPPALRFRDLRHTHATWRSPSGCMRTSCRTTMRSSRPRPAPCSDESGCTLRL